MKSELSALELHYLVEEFSVLVNGRIDQIYHPDKNEVILQFHVPSIGRKILRILLPHFIYLTEEKKENPEKISGFCQFLRKRLENAKLKEIRQKNSERILEFMFEAKDGKINLMVELFSKGNVIVCDENHNILSVLENQEFKDRVLKHGVKYEFPKNIKDFFDLSFEGFKEIVKKSEKDIVKTLAADVGLGGLFSEEILLLSKIDKNKKELDENEIKILFSNFKKILSAKLGPRIVYKDSAPIDIIPFDLEKYKEFEQKQFKTFNEAIDSAITKGLIAESRKPSKKEKEIEKLNTLIQKQEAQIKELEKTAEENQKKGEFVYENYQKVKEILEAITKAREKYSWKEIKEKAKGNKTVKDVNEAKGEITMEI